MRERHSIGVALGLGMGLLVLDAAPGRADETFLCADGTSVTLESGNREAMQDHPCVKAWFADERARRQAQNAAEGEQGAGAAQPIVRRHTVRRAMALRDLQNRPAYLAWARNRSASGNGGRAPWGLRFGRR